MADSTQTLRLKHLLAIRWFHWINFPLLGMMIWSGILIYWAYSPYHIGGFHIFPEWFVDALNINFRLAEGMALHFLFMWLFVTNGILYVGYTILSGEWKMLVPRRFSAFRDAWHVFLHDLHLRKEVPAQDKYNAAQQIAYTAIIVMGVGSLLSGLAIYKPVQLAWLVALQGGYRSARLIHFLLAAGYVGFFAIHIMQVVLAGWNNFRSMVMGYELVNDHE